uniref:Doublesex variant E n=1 Tax=Oncopeltus fasciatus TaxID=7536 RepID=A0A977JMU8_ONCFA|nr:doublesex variant E [Oncopeltus fasciatus]
MMEAVSRYPKKVMKRKYCAKCQKHNMMKEVKGHKNDCPFTSCPCEHCRKIEVKRYTSRMNVKKRRADSLQEELAARRAQDANAEREACVEPLPPQPKQPSINKLKEVVSKKLYYILQKAPTQEEARHRITQGKHCSKHSQILLLALGSPFP